MRTTALRVLSVLAIALLFVIPSLPASATNIVYWTFIASLDTGSLSGTTFPVCYSYDADQVAPSGESYVQLNSFDFTLGDARFTRNDIFQGGQVIFSDGVAHDVTASFQVFMPPNSPVNNITFGFGGDGVIGYIDLSSQYGDGSFDLSSQTPNCSGAQPSPLRNAVTSPTAVSRSLTPSPAPTSQPHSRSPLGRANVHARATRVPYAA